MRILGSITHARGTLEQIERHIAQCERFAAFQREKMAERSANGLPCDQASVVLAIIEDGLIRYRERRDAMLEGREPPPTDRDRLWERLVNAAPAMDGKGVD